MNGMGSKVPLLSICIPTYNRSKYLEEALRNITSDPDFDSRVEIIISDNASTDHTQMVSEKYANQFNNIFYYRNDENIRDRNFYLALSRAHGKYVRLFNDTLRLKYGSLKTMLSIIEQSSDGSFLFFYQNIPFLKGNTSKNIIGIHQFTQKTSYYMTWIANFGSWKNMLNLIEEPEKYSQLQLMQVDWSLQLVSKSQSGVVVYSDFFDSVVPEKKGGYNIFKVFVNNYFFIICSYLNSGVRGKLTFELEKYRMLKYFILPWYNTFFYRGGSDFTFDIKDADRIIFEAYKYSFYYYLFMVFIRLRITLNKFV